MFPRFIEKNIITSLNQFPAVGIIGPRQVGKTTLAKHLIAEKIQNSIYLDLELESDAFKLADPEIYLRQHTDKLVIIDEIQRAPNLFPLLRALIDQNRIPGRFLILDSANVDLLRQSSESLAGRIRYHHLYPFNLVELGLQDKDFQEFWIKGGYPESYLAPSVDSSIEWRRAYVNTIIERDVQGFGARLPSVQIKRLLTMLAHNHGQIRNINSLSKSLGIVNSTVKRYIDLLEDMFIIRQLAPFFTNVKKRLVKSPKIYICDSGLLHQLLNIANIEDLLSNPIAGHSWEGFVIDEILKILPEKYSAYYYRSQAGAELDLILCQAEQPVAVLEVKFSLTPVLGKPFFNAYIDFNNIPAFIIYPGNDTIQLKENVYVISLPEFLKKMADGI